jgi:orotidine-5'-phosphate decarboxylase
MFEFNMEIIEATHDLVSAYKPNSAFYEARGADGVLQLKMTMDYLRDNYPEIVTIDDAKRADIGSTNEGYAQSIFDYFGFDGVTIHPYLGREAMQPFLDREDKGLIVLCRTSNPGAGEFQDLMVGSRVKPGTTGSEPGTTGSEPGMTGSEPWMTGAQPLYKVVAEKVVSEWNKHGNCLLVTGATYPEELAEIRAIAGEMTFLVPGIGAQGGDVEKTVKAGLNSQKAGMIINSARGIIFAGSGEDFADVARTEAMALREEINKWR